MCRKLIYAIPFILSLSLVLKSTSRADLIGWWRFDESSGTTAVDSTGNGNEGTLKGDPKWVLGQIGGALELDGDDYVECGNSGILNITEQITLAAWVKPDLAFAYPNWSGIIMRGGPNPTVAPFDTFAFYYHGPNQQLGFKTTGTDPAAWMPVEAPGLFDGQWHHVAVVYDGTVKTVYLDGEPIGTAESTGSIVTSNSRLLLGAGRDLTPPTHYLVGLIDDARIYDEALEQVELQAAMEGGEVYPKALAPSPADGALIQDTWANLSWSPGDFAVSHDVYVGDNFDDVDSGAEGTFIGNQEGTFIVVGFPGFPYPDGLVPGMTYYWRIDEVNDTEPNSPWKGDVWSFSIPPKTAYFPDPADGAEAVSVDVQLSWTAGYGAKLHTVYFGDNFEEVDNATGGQTQGTLGYTPGTLKMAKTYYWRVDEFDVIETHKGNVWSFTTEGGVAALDPVNGAVDVTQTPILTWTPGVLGASHEVYFGTDAASLELKGSGNLGSENLDPGQLEWNTTYYWRVDEVNNANVDSPWTGPLWSFTTANFLIIDDMESYNDINEGEEGSNRIYIAWIDGFDDPTNGSQVGNLDVPIAEQNIVHGGLQSMPMFYDNSVGKSEATLTLTDKHNWTVNGVTTLTIWFRGDGANAAEQTYVALNGNARVDHDKTDATTITSWTEWNIPLQAFADQGVNLTNVTSITIGLRSVTGGTGVMYFDDIRLYPPAP